MLNIHFESTTCKKLVATPALREVCMGSGAVLCFHGTEKEESVRLKQDWSRLDFKKDFLK